MALQWLCPTQAKNIIKHRTFYTWLDHLASQVLDNNRTPVFWSGFWPGGEEGIDTREALADFISSVNGFQLADTEWGQAAESKGANNLENCTWDRKKNWWNAASIKMAQAMAFHNVQNIMIALHKTFQGDYSFYKTVLYRAELPRMGAKMREKSTWNPQFEVRSIAVKGAPGDESGCALASAAKFQLERDAKRPVTVWCRTCTTLQSCGPKQQVEKKSPKAECIEGNCRNGQGTLFWADGQKYQGQWKNGQKEGQGAMTWADGSIYQGQWKNNMPDGQGSFAYPIYQGEWKNGKKDGQGTLTDANGDKYKGQWKNNKRDGQGTLTNANGDKYKGQWKNNKRDGQGTYTWANGDIYEGQWKNNMPDGQGSFAYPIYQGEWKNGEKDGQGTLTNANGDKFKVWYQEGHLTKKAKKEVKISFKEVTLGWWR